MSVNLGVNKHCSAAHGSIICRPHCMLQSLYWKLIGAQVARNSEPFCCPVHITPPVDSYLQNNWQTQNISVSHCLADGSVSCPFLPQVSEHSLFLPFVLALIGKIVVRLLESHRIHPRTLAQADITWGDVFESVYFLPGAMLLGNGRHVSKIPWSNACLPVCKFSLEQAMKARRGSRCIAVLFLHLRR